MSHLKRTLEQRYARHLVLPEVGPEGQQKLADGSVLIVGVGGLGSPAALYLTAAGVGKVGLVDFDKVELSNIQRQVLYDSPQKVGDRKTLMARKRLNKLNPHVLVKEHNVNLDSTNAMEIIKDYDVVIDGSDNFPTRYLVNDACILTGKPLAYGSIYRFEGQASLFNYQKGPCYRCIFPKPPPFHLVPSCAEGGVLGVLPGVIGSIQATEALKVLLGIGRTLSGRLLLYDALNLDFRMVRIPRVPECPVCGTEPRITELEDYEAFCAPVNSSGPKPASSEFGRTHGPSDTSRVSVGSESMVQPITAEQLADQMGSSAAPQLIDVRQPGEHSLCHIPGSKLIPMAELPERMAELDRERSLVLYCHVGMRSKMAANFLLRQGFVKVLDLQGGIDNWALKVDPGMVRY